LQRRFGGLPVPLKQRVSGVGRRLPAVEQSRQHPGGQSPHRGPAHRLQPLPPAQQPGLPGPRDLRGHLDPTETDGFHGASFTLIPWSASASAASSWPGVRTTVDLSPLWGTFGLGDRAPNSRLGLNGRAAFKLGGQYLQEPGPDLGPANRLEVVDHTRLELGLLLGCEAQLRIDAQQRS
jgi:hypothetical protein